MGRRTATDLISGSGGVGFPPSFSGWARRLRTQYSLLAAPSPSPLISLFSLCSAAGTGVDSNTSSSVLRGDAVSVSGVCNTHSIQLCGNPNRVSLTPCMCFGKKQVAGISIRTWVQLASLDPSTSVSACLATTCASRQTTKPTLRHACAAAGSTYNAVVCKYIYLYSTCINEK
jgi:hypothetical protein